MEDVLLVPQQKGETNKKEPKQLFFWLFLVCLLVKSQNCCKFGPGYIVTATASG
jgi:hypothetical protein